LAVAMRADASRRSAVTRRRPIKRPARRAIRPPTS
jgi:hypothetical protein